MKTNFIHAFLSVSNFYCIWFVQIVDNENQRTPINTYPHKQSTYLIIYVMIIIVTSINLILTHQIFVGMTLKTNKLKEFPLIIFILSGS